MTSEVRCEARGGLGEIVLNRPEVLNSLNLGMLQAMYDQLLAWAGSPEIKAVLVRGAGDKAFCAGGDVRAVWEGRGDDEFMDRVYRVEYLLDDLISNYPKPYIALMYGVTMGGGCGVSVHGSSRVVDETTVLAMPETAIGLFPDIAGTHFLSRCPGSIGMYLALTGARLSGADAVYSGLADYFVPRTRTTELIDRLAQGEQPEAALSSVEVTAGDSRLAADRPAIDRCFGRASVSEIVAALAEEPGAWAEPARRALAAASPTSLEITFRAIREARSKTVRECLITDFRIAQRLMRQHDYFEGVRALIIDKDRRPAWQPATLALIDPAAIAQCFEPWHKDMRFPDSPV